jgi:hypothetical protein
MALAQPKISAQAPPRIANPRRARSAAQTRYGKTTRAAYGGLIRTGAVLGLALFALMGYVMLTSSMTSLSYAVARAHHERDLLQQDTARLDDRLAVMRSDERLAAMAKRLGMREPQTFALVTLAPTQPVATHFPVFDKITGWLAVVTPHRRVR